MPVPQQTPMRFRSQRATSSPLAASACAAAAIASCDTRSRFAISASLNSGAGSQSTIAPTCAPEPCASSSGSRRMPGRPSASDRLNSRTELPSGETTPIPVIAARRRPIARRRSGLAGGGQRCGDLALEVGEGLDASQVVIGDADAELFLDLEHELDEAERIDAERVERRARVEAARIDRELLGGHFLDAGKRVHAPGL